MGPNLVTGIDRTLKPVDSLHVKSNISSQIAQLYTPTKFAKAVAWWKINSFTVSIKTGIHDWWQYVLSHNETSTISTSKVHLFEHINTVTNQAVPEFIWGGGVKGDFLWNLSTLRTLNKL